MLVKYNYDFILLLFFVNNDYIVSDKRTRYIAIRRQL